MRAKTVNEAMNFNREDDPKGSLGIGMMGQLKALAKARGKNIENMDDVGFFLVAAWENRHDLMDYLLSAKKLDINSQECEILRVLGWWEYIDLGIHLIQKRGADLERARDIASVKGEWKTGRAIDLMKEKIESTKPTPVYEVQNFERGGSPRATMELGGINLQEDFAFDFEGLFERYIKKLRKLEGKTISCAVRIGFDPVRKTLKVARMYDPGFKLDADDLLLLTQWFEDDKGDRYEMMLKEKIYIENES